MRRRDEQSLQRAIAQALRLLGWQILSTSRHLKRCRGCGRWPPFYDGADRGLPDLLCRCPDWPRGRWLGLEVKEDEGRPSSPQQAQLIANGSVLVARSVREALALLGENETAVKEVRL